jgi:hypothetical protein
LGAQFPGLSFTNTNVLTSGVSLNPFEFPPHSGTKVAADNGGPISIVFNPAVASVSGYFTYSQPLTIVAFDSGNHQVASAASHFSTNEALSGDPGSVPNELLTVSSASGVAKVTITCNPSGSSFTLDDLTVSGSGGGTASPLISEVFSAPSIPKNGSAVLTFMITNPTSNTLPITGLAFTDTLPSGIALASSGGTMGSCGGTVSAVTGSRTVALIGGNLAAGGSCNISVNIIGIAPGIYANLTGPILSANAGTGNGASATITVVGATGAQNFFQIGVFRGPSGGLGTFALDVNGNYNYDSGVDKFRFFGLGGDRPVAGDWFGIGVVSLGVFRCPTAGVCQWYIDANNNGTWDGVAGGDLIWTFGLSGDLPIVGDWKGDGISRIGVMRCPPLGQPGLCTWYLDAGNKHTYDPNTVVITQYGLPGDLPVVNNWLGTGAIDQIGVFRCPQPNSGVCTWIVDSNGDGAYQTTDAQYSYGLSGDMPIIGAWFGVGRKRLGVFRNGTLILNVIGNNMFTLGQDLISSFGLPGDLPVIGYWTMP